MDLTLTKQVNEMIGKYQTEGMEYMIKPERKHAFSMPPYQAKSLAEITAFYNYHGFDLLSLKSI